MIRFHTNAGDFRGLRISLRRSDPVSSRAGLCITGQPWLGEFPVTAGRQADDSNLRSGEPALFNNGGEHAENLTRPNVEQHNFLQIDNDPSAQAEPSRGGCSPDLILESRANAHVEARPSIGRQVETRCLTGNAAGKSFSVAECVSRLSAGRTVDASWGANSPALIRSQLACCRVAGVLIRSGESRPLVTTAVLGSKPFSSGDGESWASTALAGQALKPVSPDSSSRGTSCVRKSAAGEVGRKCPIGRDGPGNRWHAPQGLHGAVNYEIDKPQPGKSNRPGPRETICICLMG